MTATPRSVLRIGVTELRRRPGTQRRVHVAAPLPGLAISSAQVPGDAELDVDLTLESIDGALTATGTVRVPWEGECRRCLEPVRGELEVPVSEVFEPNPTEGDTYLLEHDEVDLEPVVRDAALLNLPLAPLCRDDCPGPAPDAFPAQVADADADDEGGASGEGDERPPDPRWAGLDDLEFD